FDFGDGNTNTNPNPCHIYDEPGMYQVTLKAFGCGFDSVFTMVEIFSLPFVSILNDDIVCPGEAISFVADVDNVVDYFWDFGDGSTTTLSEPEHAFTDPGTYTVSLIGFSMDSCAYKDSVMITIVGAPIAGFQAVQDSLCSGDMVTFNNLSSPDVETCFWDFGDGNFSNVCSPTHIYLAPDNYTVTLMVTNNSGCTDTLSQIVNIFAAPLPMFDFVLDQECTPAILTIINSSINAQSYSWDFGNGDTSTDTNPTTTYNLGGDYMIQLTAMNGLCERGISLPLTIYQTPEPIMALSDDVACAPATIIFEAIDSTPDLIYEWDFGDGLTAFDSLTTHTFTDPETYTIQLTISSSNCKDSISQEIIINPPVEINAEGTDILCFGQLTGAINISVISGTAPFQYDWSNGIITEDQGSIGAGAYQLTVTDSNGCFLEELFTLTEPLPITATLVDSSIVTCYGGDDGSVCIEVSGGVAAYTILWENNIEESCIDNMVADQYEVSITDANNCTEISIFEVFEHPPIEVIDTAINISCFGFADGQILLDTITGGVSDFYNTILEGPVSYTGGMSFSDLLPGNYHLMVQDLEGCLFETDYIIGEPDSLWLNIREDSLFIGMGDSIEIESAHNADMPLLAWSPATALSCADCEDPFASPLSTTTYVLNLIDQNGCIAIDTVLVLVDPNRQFYIPNTFTPNGDGRNDVFRIRSRLASIQQVNIFRVFDRWGEMVFESSSFRPQDERLEDAWDGTFRGRLLNPDTYVFYVEVIYLDGETEIEEGTVTLIR
ncbi:MAG: gliding motility-associated-like protein, partial [Saprospiraceae bacterium]